MINSGEQRALTKMNWFASTVNHKCLHGFCLHFIKFNWIFIVVGGQRENGGHIRENDGKIEHTLDEAIEATSEYNLN